MPVQRPLALGLLVMLLALLALAGNARAEPAKRILVMGDSLSAAYGLAVDQGWVTLLQSDIKDGGWHVINASISGETTAGGRSRMASALAEHQPDIVLIELGANDGLRGLPLDLAKRNLAAMITQAQQAGSQILLIGMQIPPNYGPDYTQQFVAMYQQLALEHSVALVPFLLAPIAGSRDAFLPDQLHPNADSQRALAAHVLPALRPLMQQLESGAQPAPATP